MTDEAVLVEAGASSKASQPSKQPLASRAQDASARRPDARERRIGVDNHDAGRLRQLSASIAITSLT